MYLLPLQLRFAFSRILFTSNHGECSILFPASFGRNFVRFISVVVYMNSSFLLLSNVLFYGCTMICLAFELAIF